MNQEMTLAKLAKDTKNRNMDEQDEQDIEVVQEWGHSCPRERGLGCPQAVGGALCPDSFEAA